MRSSRASASAAPAPRVLRPAGARSRSSRRSPPRGRGRRPNPPRARRRPAASAEAHAREGAPMRAGGEMGRVDADSAQRFSLRSAARILEVPEARLRALARAGLLTPQRGPIGPLSFGFQDLLLLRTTKGLLESGVPMRQIRRIWASLREQLAAELPLTSISIHTDGEEVVASDGDTRWRPDSGQVLLNFEASEIVQRAE